MSGILFGVLVGFLVYIFIVAPFQDRRARENNWLDSQEGEDNFMAVCKLPPKGWACKRPGGHEGPCPAYPTNVPLKFLRRNADGKLERLVSTDVWTGWISAEYPSRYWYVFKAIAKARGI